MQELSISCLDIDLNADTAASSSFEKVNTDYLNVTLNSNDLTSYELENLGFKQNEKNKGTI